MNEDMRNGVVAPFSLDEIKGCLRMMRNSAPGIDRVTISELRKVDCRLLSILFTGLLACGNLPMVWKRNYTVLIPKTGGDLKSATCWRPLTISCLCKVIPRHFVP